MQGIENSLSHSGPHIFKQPCRAQCRWPRRSLCPTLCFATAFAGRYASPAGSRTQERILRYPDGRVRHIRYPAPSAELEQDPVDSLDALDIALLYEDNWHPDSWDTIDWAWDVPSKWDQQPRLLGQSPAGQARQQPVAQPSTPQLPKRREIPSTPAALLKQLNSEGYLQAQKQQQRSVRESYEVHEGSPWVQSRTVYVLVMAQQPLEQALVYSQRTRVGWRAMEDEMTKLLKRRRPDGSPVIKVDQLLDGVAMFEDAADAERFGSFLEADTSREVAVAAVDCHSMFRNVQSARGVVVLFRRGANLPMPAQLAVSLRGQQSLED